MKRFHSTTNDLIERASDYAISHPFPECWGFGAIGDYCPKEKPTLDNAPIECRTCPLYKPKKLKKRSYAGRGSGGYGGV